jgi:septal ring-binding cell division protein DamX
MLEFIKKNQLLKQNEIAYYESTFKGHPWYEALYGIYPTMQEAQLAANKLTGSIRQAGPWIRKLSEVQKEIEK